MKRTSRRKSAITREARRASSSTPDQNAQFHPKIDLRVNTSIFQTLPTDSSPGTFKTGGKKINKAALKGSEDICRPGAAQRLSRKQPACRRKPAPPLFLKRLENIWTPRGPVHICSTGAPSSLGGGSRRMGLTPAGFLTLVGDTRRPASASETS